MQDTAARAHEAEVFRCGRGFFYYKHVSGRVAGPLRSATILSRSRSVAEDVARFSADAFDSNDETIAPEIPNASEALPRPRGAKLRLVGRYWPDSGYRSV